jgi:hypothetical protein
MMVAQNFILMSVRKRLLDFQAIASESPRPVDISRGQSSTNFFSGHTDQMARTLIVFGTKG